MLEHVLHILYEQADRYLFICVMAGNIDSDKRHEVDFLMFIQKLPQRIRIMLTLRYGE